MAEHRTVDARVVGSKPIAHPNDKKDLPFGRSFFICLLEKKAISIEARDFIREL